MPGSPSTTTPPTRTRRLTRRRTSLSALAVTALATPLVLAGPTPATASPADRADGNTSATLQEAVTVEGVLRHLYRFQQIAAANGGNRAAGTPGHDASAQYVHDVLLGAGYDVRFQEFDFPFFEETAPPLLQGLTPEGSFGEDDVATMTFSSSGDVTAPVTAVDLDIPPANPRDSGCEASDFAGFPRGNIALIQRGTCTFVDKARNAAAAGASAVIIFNGGVEGQTAVFRGTLTAPFALPVLGASYDVGVTLAAADTTVRLRTQTVSETRTTRNVIANSRTGSTDNVVMAGAHLDSVVEGPGFNDNGSGSAAILEVAIKMAKTKPRNQVRFAWWSAEELGLLGSANYVSTLSTEEREKIALYLNFDMVGSPNYFRGVYDGDGSSFGLTGPAGSGAIENVFNEHFTAKGLPFQGTEFSGRSDYQAFINNDIPAGGLFTGAEGVKTEAEAALYGGVAGAAYDPCYHDACDNGTGAGRDAELYDRFTGLDGNVNSYALSTNSDAIAHAISTFAYDTSAVNGVVTPAPARGAEANRDGGYEGDLLTS